MKSSIILMYFVISFLLLYNVSVTYACHKGGSMGTASKDPLNSTLDISSGYTFIFASTSGTLGCKNWDFVKNNRVQYLDLAWRNLSEEVAQGEGEHLVALSEMYGCQEKYQQTFKSVLYGNYQRLFLEMKKIESYERAHLLENEINILIEKSSFKDQCSNISTS